MLRRRPSLLATFAVVLSGLALVAACTSEKEAACTVDADCAQGSFCRSGTCAVVATTNDSGLDSAPPPLCVGPGSSCSVDLDCCSPPCTGFRCGGAGSSGTSGKSSSGTSGTSGTSSGTTSGGGNCQSLYGLCSFDGECCTGLACSNGSCR